MAKTFLIIFSLLSLQVHGQIFNFGSEEKPTESGLTALVEQLESLKVSDDPSYEESFNLVVKKIEDKIEEEKLFCSGEAQNTKGEVLPASKKQLCMRALKKNYMEATTAIFEVKKKYLGYIHKRQIEKLSEIQDKLKADIEKNF